MQKKVYISSFKERKVKKNEKWNTLRKIFLGGTIWTAFLETTTHAEETALAITTIVAF